VSTRTFEKRTSLRRIASEEREAFCEWYEQDLARELARALLENIGPDVQITLRFKRVDTYEQARSDPDGSLVTRIDVEFGPPSAATPPSREKQARMSVLHTAGHKPNVLDHVGL
jgi:hypothetical protein